MAESQPSHEAKDNTAIAEIPTTRVELVDGKLSHGEVPGTEAYKMRSEDAVPDELEILPNEKDSGQATSVPITVVDKVESQKPSYGEVPGTHAHALRLSDARPDVVRDAPQINQEVPEGTPTISQRRYDLDDGQADLATINPVLVNETSKQVQARRDTGSDNLQDATSSGETAFGEDFDDFEEGNGEDDFGDFDQGDLEDDDAHDSPKPDLIKVESYKAMPLLDVVPSCTIDQATEICQPYICRLFGSQGVTQDAPEMASQSFLSERSQSLWSQLVAPPPLQPPDWIRSRIRRLFLVSLGVPVDLDEILPASKQKKLVLPSIDLEADRPAKTASIAGVKPASSSPSGASFPSGTTRSSSRPERKRRGLADAPSFDLNTTRLLCSTTDAALHNMTDAEVGSHLEQLRSLNDRAGDLLRHWLLEKDSAKGDKEAFESVIENLVKHAKKVRR